MKNQLTVENLYFTTYDEANDTYELQFDLANGTKVFIRNVKAPEASTDEFYFDDADNVKKAVDEASDDDIEVDESIASKVTKLINSELTAYTIGKETGITNENIRKLKTGESKIENVRLIQAEKLASYWDEVVEAYEELKGFLDTEAKGGVKDFDPTPLKNAKKQAIVHVDGYYDDKFVLSQKELDIEHKDVYMVDYLNAEIYVYKIA